MSQSTRKKPEKPEKPYPDFPLFPHANGRWCKKIRQRHHYFGLWADWKGALEKYQAERDDLHAGRTPRVNVDGLTVADLCNRFMTAKQQALDAGDIVLRTFADYLKTCKLIVDSFGKTRLVDDLAADDFAQLRASIAKRRGPVSLGVEVQRVRTCFKFAYDAGLIEHPIRFGPGFKKPARRIIRAVRQGKGPRMFEADELRRMIDAADHPLKAMILLAANAGLGNSDCGKLPKSALNLTTGWMDYPRPKTSVERRAPLWPETVEALQEAIKQRPKPMLPRDGRLVFITRYGSPWTDDAGHRGAITKETRRLLESLNLYRTLGFYAIRHSFATVAGESCDQVAVNHIMGHADSSMAGVYRERISDERLRAVTDFVHNWLFSEVQ